MVSCVPFSSYCSNRLHHVVDLRVAHAGVETDPERGVHDGIGVGKRAGHAVVDALAHRLEAGMAYDVARKEVARLDVL